MKILNDVEHRIFLSAMSRERKVCSSPEFFDEFNVNKLLDICDSIERKVNDSVPVVHGHWIYDASDMRCVCSECKHHLFQIVRPVEFKSFAEQNKFCFNCGADMRERKTE